MKYLLHTLLWLFAHCPLWVMKAVSSFAAWLNWYAIGYRKKVVMDNLRKAFPEKTDSERRVIARKFYVQLLDYLLAMVRQRYNKRPVLNRFVFYKNPELLHTLYKQGKSVIIAQGHYFLWEYTNTSPLVSDYRVIAAYSPLSSKFADNMMMYCRSVYGVQMFPMNEIYRALIRFQQQKILTGVLMVADQSPTADNLEHWITFLGQDTPVLIGVEHIAKKLNQAVVFVSIKLRKRFVYEYELVLITDNPAEEPPMAITKRWYAELEKEIHRQPELYLWSHRRWKHQAKKP